MVGENWRVNQVPPDFSPELSITCYRQIMTFPGDLLFLNEERTLKHSVYVSSPSEVSRISASIEIDNV